MSVVASLRFGEAEAAASSALVVYEATHPRISDRRMREVELTRRESVGDAFGDAGTDAKERHLKAEGHVRVRRKPSRDVPPLDAVLGMRAVIARKSEDAPGSDLGMAHGSGRDRRARKRCARAPGEKSATPHQSSFTARTASIVIALRPLAIAVAIASASSAATNAPRGAQGTKRSIPQWNDCRFTT